MASKICDYDEMYLAIVDQFTPTIPVGEGKNTSFIYNSVNTLYFL